VKRGLILSWTLAVLLAMTGCGGEGPAEPEPVDAPVAAETETPADAEQNVEEQAAAPLQMRTVEIYFPSALENGLVGERREIFDTATPGDQIKQIVADLISGPTGADALRVLPPGTLLRQAYILDNGVAFLDFSSELTEGMGGGSMSEILAVYAIIDSVVLNIAEITRVGILVNGRPLKTLNGHLDLQRALPADHKLILGSIIVRGPEESVSGLLAEARVEEASRR